MAGAKVEAEEVACGSARRSRGSAAAAMSGLLKRIRCLDVDGHSGIKGGREGTGGVVRVEKSVADVLLALDEGNDEVSPELVPLSSLDASGTVLVVNDARRRWDRVRSCSTWTEGFFDRPGLGSSTMGGLLSTAESVLRRGRVRCKMLSMLLVMLRLAIVITN